MDQRRTTNDAEGASEADGAVARAADEARSPDGAPSSVVRRPSPVRPGATSTAADAYRARFEAALDADLDTPAAIDVLLDLAAAIQRRDTGARAAETLVELSAVLGLRLAGQPTTQWSAEY